MNDQFEQLVRRIQAAQQYEDRDAIHARILASGVSEEDFFLAWVAAKMAPAAGLEAAA